MSKYYKDGEPYRPSNGTERMIFHEKFCDQCIHLTPFYCEYKERNCEILMLTMGLDVDDPEYPKEWQYKDDSPICTQFQKWDWGNDGDPDDPENPKAPKPVDPNQLDMFPLYPDENSFIKKETEIKLIEK